MFCAGRVLNPASGNRVVPMFRSCSRKQKTGGKRQGEMLGSRLLDRLFNPVTENRVVPEAGARGKDGFRLRAACASLFCHVLTGSSIQQLETGSHYVLLPVSLSLVSLSLAICPFIAECRSSHTANSWSPKRKPCFRSPSLSVHLSLCAGALRSPPHAPKSAIPAFTLPPHLSIYRSMQDPLQCQVTAPKRKRCFCPPSLSVHLSLCVRSVNKSQDRSPFYCTPFLSGHL